MAILNTFLPHLFILIFIIITFGTSGYEKLADLKGQTSFLKNHFKGTLLIKYSLLLLIILVILDVAATLFSVLGIYSILVKNSLTYGRYAVLISAVVLCCLLFGQRVAKDYQGALTICCYFMVILFGLWLFTSSQILA